MRKTAYTAEILAVGSELTRGECLDRNSPFLSKGLAKLGVRVERVTTVGDDWPLLVKTLREAARRSPLLFVSGGLGPTHDDLTRQALAKASGRRLLFRLPLLRAIERRFQQRNLPMPPLNRLQAYLPEGASPLANPIGSAPGIFLRQGKHLIFCLPGVPEELTRMFQKEILPILRRKLPPLPPLVCRRLRTTGFQESVVAEKVSDILKKEKGLTFGLYAHPGIVDVTVMDRGKKTRGRVDRILSQIRRRLGPSLFGEDEETLEGVVFGLLKKRRKTVSVAESCTGGALATALTSLSGSSKHFHLGVVAYQNRAKETVLGVSSSRLLRDGAVSPSVSKAMAEGARRLGKTDLGVGVTGILGPTGGTRKKPVGLVYISLATGQRTLCYEYRFQGDREMVRRRTTLAALELLRKELLP